MQNFIQILYEEKQHDQLFNQLKAWFGEQVKQVTVFEVVPDELVRLEWKFTTDDNKYHPEDLAKELTEELPSLIIDIPSTTGIDLYSRYFNGNQLW